MTSHSNLHIYCPKDKHGESKQRNNEVSSESTLPTDRDFVLSLEYSAVLVNKRIIALTFQQSSLIQAS